jgi:hypothetical protein
VSARGRHATVVLPQLGSFPAVVDMDGADHATAMLLVRPLQPLARTVGSDVSIDIATNRGLLHVDAQVVDATAGEVLELLTGRSELIQRRGFARVDAFLEIVVTSGPQSKPIAAAVVNISASGAVVSRMAGMSLGDEVRLSLRLAPYEPPLEIAGRVVREFGEEFRAVHFEQIQESDRERIVRFVFDRQRLERRHGRM